MTLAVPESCAIAFKEWAGVCAALVEGRQSLILRKGGIAEGPGGFQPEHPAFWLYPTHVHQAQQGLKTVIEEADHDTETVALRGLAVVERLWFVDRVELVPALDDLHVWTTETVLQRFHYRRPGLWVLGVRVYRRDDPWIVPITPEQLGCKTWVPLGASLDTSGMRPVLDDEEQRSRLSRLHTLLGVGS